jgi:hypothetical protein
MSEEYDIWVVPSGHGQVQSQETRTKTRQIAHQVQWRRAGRPTHRRRDFGSSRKGRRAGAPVGRSQSRGGTSACLHHPCAAPSGGPGSQTARSPTRSLSNRAIYSRPSSKSVTEAKTLAHSEASCTTGPCIQLPTRPQFATGRYFAILGCPRRRCSSTMQGQFAAPAKQSPKRHTLR